MVALELEHIYHKVLFDAYNEALDSFRLFGLKGKPFPWKINQNRLKEISLRKSEIPRILERAQDKVIEWGTNLCGIMFDKEDSPLAPGIVLDDEYITQIKEDRLAKMLAGEVVEAEERWITYDDEATEVHSRATASPSRPAFLFAPPLNFRL